MKNTSIEKALILSFALLSLAFYIKTTVGELGYMVSHGIQWMVLHMESLVRHTSF